MVHSRAVSQALEKMNVRHRRKTLQFFQGEFQRPVHHAMKQKAIVLRLDVRNDRTTVGSDKVERRWRDDTNRILKRTQDVKRQPELVRRSSLEYRDAH